MILITRPKDQSINLKSKLEKKGYSFFQESFYSFQYLKKQIIWDPSTYYIFPSIHSVKSIKKNRQISKFINANLLVIGQQVKKALKESGCRNFVAVAPDSSAMLKIITSSNYNKKKYIYLCSNVINEEFFFEANKNKINIKKNIVYKTIGIKTLTKKLIELIELNKINGVIFYSQLSVKIYLRLLLNTKIMTNLKSIHIYCISKRVAGPLKQKNIDNIHIAKKPNEKSLISTIKKSHFYNK